MAKVIGGHGDLRISALDDDRGFKGNPGFGPAQEGEPAELACWLEQPGLSRKRRAELVKKQATEVRTGVMNRPGILGGSIPWK